MHLAKLHSVNMNAAGCAANTVQPHRLNNMCCRRAVMRGLDGRAALQQGFVWQVTYHTNGQLIQGLGESCASLQA